MWYRIFSVSFTGSKFDTWKKIIHLLTASDNFQNICSLLTSQIYQPNIKSKDEIHVFTKIKNTDGWEKKEKN